MDKKVYILLGPPGSGKGTQAKKIAPFLKIPHVSLGDLLREAVANKTEVGQKVEKFLKAGELVPDNTVIEVAEERITRSDCDHGFVFDGFPRTIVQAEIFEKKLENLGFKQEMAIYIDLSMEEVAKRLSGRRSCKSCGAVYHVDFSPPKAEGKCDNCGAELYLRPDDKKDVIENRYKVYEKQTSPLIDHYKKLGILKSFDGKQDIDKVFEGICASIKAA